MVAYYISKSALWILTIIGLVCNSLAFVTISKIKPFSTSSFYVALLAVLDTLVLLTRLIYQQMTGFDVPMGNIGCAAFTYVGQCILHISTWTLVIMTIERFVAVWFPLRVMELFTMRRAKISVAIIAVVLLLVNIHNTWTYEEVWQDPPQGLNCVPRPEYVYFHKIVWYWINSCVYAFFPCVILIGLNGLIIWGMRRSFKVQKKMTNGECVGSSKQTQQRQITIMLVTVSVAFVCFLLPICIFHLVSVNWNYAKSTEETARYHLASEIVFFVAEIHHAINFLFYFFSSRKFRTVLIKLVCCRQRSSRGSLYTSQPTVTSTSTLSTTLSMRR
ncbi:growth hormone secretagogue receptor type 1-like [Liolophura sinensis]|uniref:growth hormone secretagogue receptor type 1-like n=1 Tax=Liolophura sinensis TaxID=3198878 RepID=UPI003158C148